MITKEHITGPEISKVWQTRDGRAVRIYAVDDGEVHGAAEAINFFQHSWSAYSGECFDGREFDLIPLGVEYELVKKEIE